MTLKKDIVIASVIAVLCSFFLIPTIFTINMYPLSETGPSWMTLDPSWKLTLNRTGIESRTWGQDFVLTYGPLSYLSTRLGWGISKYHFLLFDLFMFANLLFIFFVSYLKSKSKWITVILFFFTCLLFRALPGSSLSLILMAVLVFWILQSAERYNPRYYLVQTILLTLLFFIKFNSGLVCFVFYAAGLTYSFFQYKQKRLPLLFFLLTPLLLIGLLSSGLNVSLPGYIKGGIEMVTGYNGIMYLDQGLFIELLFALFIILLLLTVLVLKIKDQKQSTLKNTLTLLLFSGSAFVLYKQASVRADGHHVGEFYTTILFLVTCMPDFYREQTKAWTHYLILLIILISTWFAKYKEAHPIDYALARFSKANYLLRLTHYTDTSGMFLFSHKNYFLPTPILERIATKSVDIYPWNSQLLIENHLNYTSRPVSQSYSAYTSYLANLNFEFYNSGHAPEYVLYELDAIDNRYALFDEPKLNLYILKHYNCVDTFRFAGRPVLLLQKGNNSKLTFEKIKEYELKITDKLIPKDGVYYEIGIAHSLAGKLISLLRYEPELNITVEQKDGTQRSYRTSKQLLKSGIFSTRHFNSTTDFYQFIRKGSLDLNSELNSYSFSPITPSLFNDVINVSEYRILD